MRENNLGREQKIHWLKLWLAKWEKKMSVMNKRFTDPLNKKIQNLGHDGTSQWLNIDLLKEEILGHGQEN